MKLTFVNHASYLTEVGDIKLLTDPWLFGAAFNNGWDLLFDTPEVKEMLESLTHIWVSHEHPDHFSPAFMTSIKEERRKEITVLFQQTDDQKVIEFCQKQGYKTIELGNNETVSISDRVKVICGKAPVYDSWLLTIVDDNTKVLNINDCNVRTQEAADKIKKVTGEVDVLLSQFSYAAWKGNRKEKLLREESAKEKLESLVLQTNTFNAKYVIPFASFVYFSHEENRYMNDSVNTPSEVVDIISNKTRAKTIALLPGDEWQVGAEHDNSRTLAVCREQYQLKDKTFRKSKSIEVSELFENFDKFINRIKKKNNFSLMRVASSLPIFGLFKPVKIYLFDIDKVAHFSWFSPLELIDGDDESHIQMHSDSLNYIFKFEWGFDTLLVNGRFHAEYSGFDRFIKTFTVSILNNLGKRFGLRLMFDTELIAKFFKLWFSFSKKMRRSEAGTES